MSAIIAASRCRVPDKCYGGGACQCGIEIKAAIADQGTFAERSIERVVSAEDITGYCGCIAGGVAFRKGKYLRAAAVSDQIVDAASPNEIVIPSDDRVF
jgi:hypothetical protein